MKYNELLKFINIKMKMSHVYQPVMIKSLLQNEGELSDYEIAKRLLNYDISQIEYYQNIVNQMVGKVLRSHSVVIKDKKYKLLDYDSLTSDQKEELIKLCNDKITDFIQIGRAHV